MRFLYSLIALSLFVAIGIGIFVHFTGYTLVHPFIWYILGFFVLITLFTFYLVQMGAKNDEENFQLYYFGSSVFRVLMSIGVIFIYVFFASGNKVQFAMNFFVIYFIYTGFEIYCILSNLRRFSKNQVSE
ncbi:hypothetical protein [Adhaeribacter aquaticus]|uniref:hypothetical protein n=1 Tax=Adhaeribacter aquaticus TaxID=299567 RepID=UPI00047B0CC8|nr:hypothetical protein [Adhaeribacter aquaticus]